MDILELVTTALASLNIFVVYGWYDAELDTHITFLEFDNEDDNYSDDEATSTNHHIQVDIWSRDAAEAQELKKQVKALLKENKLLYQDGQDKYETDTQLWHIATRWLIVENLE